MNELIILLAQLAEIFFVIGALVLGFGLIVKGVNPGTGATVMRAGLYAISGAAVCMIAVALMA